MHFLDTDTMTHAHLGHRKAGKDTHNNAGGFPMVG